MASIFDRFEWILGGKLRSKIEQKSIQKSMKKVIKKEGQKKLKNEVRHSSVNPDPASKGQEGFHPSLRGEPFPPPRGGGLDVPSVLQRSV